MDRAFSILKAKSFNDDDRTFSGWATTPAVDRVNDIVNPKGVRFKNPLSLLHQHDPKSPIGHVRFGKATEKGIEFQAKIEKIDAPDSLKERVDVAWAEIKHGLVRAVSIGFRPIKHVWNDERGGIDFEEIEVFELSTVTIPALPEAVITSFKSMDSALYEKIRRSNSVRLKHVEKPKDDLPSGAVRLISP